MDLSKIIRDIPDFPKPGILFKDITTVLQDPEALVYAVDQFTDRLKEVDFDLVIGPESRGFIFGVPISYNMKKGFIPVRKKGKLPFTTKSKEYALEYGTAEIEIHTDAVKPGQKVVIVDDLLATGGTTRAIIELLEEMGAEIVKIIYLIELDFLNGREVVGEYNIDSIVKF